MRPVTDAAPGTSRRAGVALVAVSAASFGAMAIFARFAYRSGADVPTVLALRFATSAVALHVVVRVRRLSLPRGRTLVSLAMLGGIGYVGQSLSYFTALTLAPAGLVALLLYLYPGFVTVLASLTGRDHLTRIRLVALLLALVGCALTIGGGFAQPGNGLALGALLALVAAAIYAVYIVASSGPTARAGAIPSATVITSAAAVVLCVPLLTRGAAYPQDVTGWLAICAMSLISTVLAIITFFAGLARLGPSTTATLSTLEPVVTVALAAALLAEPLRLTQLAGGALILGAALLLVREPPRAPASQTG